MSVSNYNGKRKKCFSKHTFKIFLLQFIIAVKQKGLLNAV